MPTLASLGRVTVVSPHLDDAVLSCGRLLAAHPGSTVVTVFAGIPGPGVGCAGWDARCGFDSGRQAMGCRRDEDRAALSRLEAWPAWLEFLDSQYADPPAPAEVARALHTLLLQSSPDTVLLPLGLFHADHLLAHEAGRQALRQLPGVRCGFYEDVPYRAIEGLLQQRLMALGQDGCLLTPLRLASPSSEARKSDALRAYASQLRGLGEGGLDDARAPERCWLVAPAAQAPAT